MSESKVVGGVSLWCLIQAAMGKASGSAMMHMFLDLCLVADALFELLLIATTNLNSYFDVFLSNRLLH